jgi:hypothetical protein
MKLTNRCQFNGKTYEMEINCTPAQLAEGTHAYSKGALLQNAFPFLNANEREFLKTGTPPHVWDEMFGEPKSSRSDFAPDERAASDANERYYGAGD